MLDYHTIIKKTARGGLLTANDFQKGGDGAGYG